MKWGRRLLWSPALGCKNLRVKSGHIYHLVSYILLSFPLSLLVLPLNPNPNPPPPNFFLFHSHQNQSIMEEAAVVTTLPLPLLSLSLPHKSIYHAGGNSCNHTGPPTMPHLSLGIGSNDLVIPGQRQPFCLLFF